MGCVFTMGGLEGVVGTAFALGGGLGDGMGFPNAAFGEGLIPEVVVLACGGGSGTCLRCCVFEDTGGTGLLGLTGLDDVSFSSLSSSFSSFSSSFFSSSSFSSSLLLLFSLSLLLSLSLSLLLSLSFFLPLRAAFKLARKSIAPTPIPIPIPIPPLGDVAEAVAVAVALLGVSAVVVVTEDGTATWRDPGLWGTIGFVEKELLFVRLELVGVSGGAALNIAASFSMKNLQA